jgi:hypothetical protein
VNWIEEMALHGHELRDSQELTMVLDARAQCPYLDMSTAPIIHYVFSHDCFVRILRTNVLEVSDASSTRARGLPSVREARPRVIAQTRSCFNIASVLMPSSLDSM